MNTLENNELSAINFEFDKYNKVINDINIKYPFRKIFQKRAFQAICVGTPKSGTHSIASMLGNYRSYHEINDTFLISLIRKKLDNSITYKELQNIFRLRDNRNWLEMDSAHYNGFFAKELRDEFQQAKFVLTIRDCFSWIDSWFNHQLSREIQLNNSIYDFGRKNYYSRGFEYTAHDQFLQEFKLFPIKSYFQFWHQHNSNILNTIPEEQLLIIKTNNISQSSDALSHFLNIQESSLKITESHNFKAKFKHQILNKIDPDYLMDCALEYCGELNDTIFPEKTIYDSIAKLKSEK